MSVLTSLLVRDGVVPVRKIEEALQRQVISGGDVETVLLEMDAVPENVLSAYRAAVFDLTPASREEVSAVLPEVIELVPREVAIEHRLLPLRVEDRKIHVAVHEPLTPEQEERIGFLLGFDLVTHIACEVRIAAGLALHYEAELAPRMIRLVDRVRNRSSGALPEVGSVVRGLSDLPDKRPSAPAPALRTSRSGSFILEPAPLEPDPVLVEKAAAPPPDDEASTAARLRRLRGPMTLSAGEQLLKRATDRDQILEVFFAFGRQFFDYTALFVVHDDVADGREAYGVGAPTEQVRALSVPLDQPSAFAEVVRTRVPQVRALDRTTVDRDIALGLRRPACPPALIVPIAIRQRIVLILYGDRDGEAFDIGSAMELVRFAPRVVETLEQLIIRNKRIGYHKDQVASERAAERAPVDPETKALAKMVAARAGAVRKVPIDGGEWKPGRHSSPGFETPGDASDEPWGSDRAPRPDRAAPTQPQVERPEPAPTAREPRRPASLVLGIPRQAPPPPPAADLDLGPMGLDDEEADLSFDLDDPDLLFVAGVSTDGSEDEPEVDEDLEEDDPEGGDEGDEEQDDAAEDDDASEDDDYDGDEDDDDDDDAAEDDDDEDDDGAGGADERVEARPPSIRSAPYRQSDAPVDVIRPERRSDRPRALSDRPLPLSDRPRPFSDRPDPLADRPSPLADRPPPLSDRPRPISERPDPLSDRSRPISERPDPHSDGPRSRRSHRQTPRDPRRDDDESTRLEVVRVPSSILSEPPRQPPPVDASQRSVIVDMGAQVHAQVDALLAAADERSVERAIQGILATGEAALPALAQAFPGPLSWTREQGGRVPRARDISAIARALVAFGPVAGSYVGGLLSSGHPDIRLYAAVVAGEMICVELMDAVAERVYDEDQGVRRIAVQLIPRFAGFRGFDEIRTVLRRAARIRGKDLSRRWQAIDALTALRDVEMIPKMIDLLREDDAELEKHTLAALVALSCADLGRSHKKWTAWWERNRNRHRIEWLIDGLLHGDESIREAAGDELKRLTQEYYGYHPGSPKRDRERVARRYREWWEKEGASRFA